MAVMHARTHFDDIGSCRVLVVGAGDAGRLALQALYKQGVRKIAIANRTRQRALEVAEEFHADALTFEQLSEGLHLADVVITSTGAPHPILSANRVREATLAREGRPLVILDIAVPRDVDPVVRDIPGIHLYDLDGLKGQVDDTLLVRKQEIPQVIEIIDQEADRYMDWLRHVEVLPVLKEIRQQAETIRRQELARLRKRMPDLDENVADQLNRFSKSLVNKLFHHPMVELRSAAGSDHGAAYAEMMRNLFRLPLQDDPNHSDGIQADV
jgi:glutamyl-tRNA reductase